MGVASAEPPGFHKFLRGCAHFSSLASRYEHQFFLNLLLLFYACEVLIATYFSMQKNCLSHCLKQLSYREEELSKGFLNILYLYLGNKLYV
jgi:hypothetical protein